MQLSILKGIYATQGGDFRTALPRNLVPVPKSQGISSEYLRPADGLVLLGTGPGACRGGINWNGAIYRVMGTSLVRIDAAGTPTTLGDVGGSGPASMDYSFDRLGIASAGKLWFWNGSALSSVTDPDIGTVLDVRFIGGYWMTTDGANLVVMDLDQTAVNPLKYGSAEVDPDPIKAVEKLHNEAVALGRHTIETFENVGGDLFPFQRIAGAAVSRGVVGTWAYAEFGGSLAFVGSGRKEAPAVWQMVPGDSVKLSTREVDVILGGYSEAQLAACVVETRLDKSHEHLLIHLPDQTLVYDGTASAVMKEPIWFTLTSSLVGLGQYRARDLVWCYDRWNIGDPTGPNIGMLSGELSSHYGAVVGWDFGTVILYADGNDGIVHEVELVCLAGRAELGADPVVWTSSSVDGQTWSQERSKRTGKQGERAQRLAWRKQGRIRHFRMQRFRGDSDSHLTMARLEIQVEQLQTRPAHG